MFDLSYDPHDLAALHDDDLHKLLPKSPRPVRRPSANRAPCIMPYEDVPASACVRLPAAEELGSRAAYIRDNRGLRGRLMAAVVENREKWKPSVHVEEQIYDSFIGSEDQARMTAFHQAEWSDRAALLGGFVYQRLQVLGQRLLYTEVPEVMPVDGLMSCRTDMARRFLAEEGTVPWLTLPQAIRETDELLVASTGSEASLLKDLLGYLGRRAEEARTNME